MDAPRPAFTARALLALAVLPVLAAACIFALQWSERRQDAAERAEADALLAALDSGTDLTLADYAAWKQLASAIPRVRSHAASLALETRYAPLLRNQAGLLGRIVVGADRDGAMSRQLAEAQLCAPLERAPASANTGVPLYLVPWLNPSGLDSQSCAQILTERVITADPGSFAAGAGLLGRVLAALPADVAQPYIARLVAAASVAAPGHVDVLFGALRHVRSTEFPEEFAAALRMLEMRITAAPDTGTVAGLFDAVGALKYAVTPPELGPLLETAIGELLARDDASLTRSVYFTLADLKTSHPDTSFGPRTDYLMRGINVYSDALEIYDYSRVLRLDEQHPGDEATVARELLTALRVLDADDYLSSIVPYCRRFLESSAALAYEEFIAGAQLLVAQLRNPRFVFQRPCLLDSGLVARIATGERRAAALDVIAALQNMQAPGAATRFAEALELLSALQADLSPGEVSAVAAVTSAYVASETEGPVKVIRAAAAADLEFPPAFYVELFVLASTVPPDAQSGRRAPLPAELLAKLPEEQRRYLGDTAVAALAAGMEPTELAAQAELLLVLKPWLSASDIERSIAALAGALEDSRYIPEYARIARALTALKPQTRPVPAGVQAAWLRHVSESNSRAELAQLFEASSPLGTIRTANMETRDTIRAAALRFLAQIVPRDEHIGAVRSIMERPAPQTTTPADAGREGTRRSQPTQAAVQRALGRSRIELEPADVERLAARYVRALIDERLTHPIADFALSLGTLADYSRPGELDDLLAALHRRLDESAAPAAHEQLVAAWVRVEKATNAQIPAAERMPLYQDIAQLPLTSAASRALLVEAAGGIAERDFAGDVWQLLAWQPDDGVQAQN